MNKKIVSIVIISALVITMGTFSIFGATDVTTPVLSITSFNSAIINGVSVTVNIRNYRPYQTGIDYRPYSETQDGTSGSNKDYVYGSSYWIQDYQVQWTISNSSDNYVSLGTASLNITYTHATMSLGSQYKNSDSSTIPLSASSTYDVEYVSGAMPNILQSANQFNLRLNFPDEYRYEQQILVPPHTSLSGITNITRHITIYTNSSYHTFLYLLNADPLNVSSVTQNINVTGFNESNLFIVDADNFNPSSIQYYNIHHIDQNVQEILNAYTGNVNGAEDLTDQAQSNDQKVATIHEQEQQWYSQNQSAIESTGLQNFEFTSNQTQGLESISNLFNNLWNSLGQWNTVYTFTLMISFSTFLLRHTPRTKRTKKEKSES